MYTIATLHQIRQHLGFGTGDTSEDNRLIVALEAATSMIERVANRRFCPQVTTRSHSFMLEESSELLLDDDLLELMTLTNGDGTVIDSGDILTIPDEGDFPIGILRLTGGNAFVYDESPINSIQVAGVWGWHNRWSQAWWDSSDTVQDNPLSSNATSLTVSDADGADSANSSPRFQVGHLLRIESEYLRVVGVDVATDTLTVLRGVNGTTAAEHAQSTSIEVYQPALDVSMLCLRWAAWLYNDPDSRSLEHMPGTLFSAISNLRRISVKV